MTACEKHRGLLPLLLDDAPEAPTSAGADGLSEVAACPACRRALRAMRRVAATVAVAFACEHAGVPRVWPQAIVELRRRRRLHLFVTRGAAVAAPILIAALLVQPSEEGGAVPLPTVAHEPSTVGSSTQAAGEPACVSHAGALGPAEVVTLSSPASQRGETEDGPLPSTVRLSSPMEAQESAAGRSGQPEPGPVAGETHSPPMPTAPQPLLEKASGSDTAAKAAAFERRARRIAEALAVARSGDARKAEALLAGIVPSTSPQGARSEHLKALGWIAWLRDRPSEARARFEVALALEPRDAEACLGSGLAGAKLRDDEVALQRLREACALEPAWTAPRLALGRLLLRRSEAAAARLELAAVAAAHPRCAAALLEGAWSAYTSEAVGEAEVAFERVLALVRRPGAGRRGSGIDSRAPDADLLELQRLADGRDLRKEAEVGLGFCAWGRGDALAASRRLEPILDAAPPSWRQTTLGRETTEVFAWSLLELSREAAALKEFDRLRAAGSGDELHARALAGRGFCLLALGRAADARKSFDESLRLCPDQPAALEGLAALGVHPTGAAAPVEPRPGMPSGTATGPAARPAPASGTRTRPTPRAPPCR